MSMLRVILLLAFTVSAWATRFDFTSDGKPDILYRNATSGATYLWRMNGLALQSDALISTIDPSWDLVGHGDFDGDGQNDLVWRSKTSGAAYVWYMNNGAFVSDKFLFSIDPVWKIEAVADFNKDTHPDFLFRHSTSGVGFVWYFNDTTPGADQFLYSIDNAWVVENTGDFNGDGFTDFFFRNTRSGVAFVWLWDGTRLGESYFLFSIDPVWQVVEIVDWNGDGKVDLLFRNDSSGVTFVWYTDGTRLLSSDFLFQVDPAWKIVPREIVAATPPAAPPLAVSAIGAAVNVSITIPANNGGKPVDSFQADACTVGSSCNAPGVCGGGSLVNTIAVSTTGSGTIFGLPTCSYDAASDGATCNKTYVVCAYAHNAVGYGPGTSSGPVQPKVSFTGDNVGAIFTRFNRCGGCHGAGFHRFDAAFPTNFNDAKNEGTWIYTCPESGQPSTFCGAMAFGFWTPSSGPGQTLRRWVSEGQQQ